MVAFTFLLTLVAAGQWFVAYQNSQSSGKQMERVLDAANRMEDAADSFSRSSAQINGGLSEAVAKLNLQAASLAEGSKQTSRLASATEIANNNALEADRPWFGPELFIRDFVVGKTPQIVLNFANSGRRPGFVIEFNHFQGFFTELPASPSFPDPNGKSSHGLIMPGRSLGKTMPLFIIPMTESIMRGMDNPQKRLFVYARITYQDPRTQKIYYSHGCIVYDPPNQRASDGAWGNCTEYNEAN